MPETVKKIAQLILKYWRQELEEEELNELLDWSNQSTANKEAFARLTDPDLLISQLRDLSMVKQEMRDRIWAELQLGQPDAQEQLDITVRNKRIHTFFSYGFRKWLTVAALLLMAGLLAYWFTMRKAVSLPGKVLTLKNNRKMLAQDSGQALTGIQVQFADGVVLDPAVMVNGAVMQQGSLSLVKGPRSICFSSAADPASTDSALFTTISTPAGEAFTVWLPDGTEVILNAASSLRFPVVFNARHRTVEASGELYFHVQQRSSREGRIPFFVYTSGMNMEVPGTRFNVHVYPKEKLATATLEEGSLRVWKQVLHGQPATNSRDRLDVILRPGQQALISNHTTGADMGGIRVEEVDLQKVLSWKITQAMENKKTPCSR
jgi:hypothetical protein